MSKESAKSCRRLEERGGQLLGLLAGCWRFFQGGAFSAGGAYEREKDLLSWRRVSGRLVTEERERDLRGGGGSHGRL